jgi:hypothetical protein
MVPANQRFKINKTLSCKWDIIVVNTVVLIIRINYHIKNDEIYLNIGLRSEKTDDSKTITALDFRLINARF